MKKLMTIFGTILFASFILTSCGGGSTKKDGSSKVEPIVKVQDKGEIFLGNWKTKHNDKVEITKAGETAFTLKFIWAGEPFVRSVSATYNNGNLVTSGNELLSYSNGKIIFRGDEYEKVK